MKYISWIDNNQLHLIVQIPSRSYAGNKHWTFDVIADRLQILHTTNRIESTSVVCISIPLKETPTYVGLNIIGDNNNREYILTLQERPSLSMGKLFMSTHQLTDTGTPTITEIIHTITDGYDTAMRTIIGQLAAILRPL